MKENEITLIENAIGYTFKDKRYLERAFTHKSLYKNKDVYDNYEQLEFLGDSILNFIIADYLYLNYPEYSEGIMTVLRSKLVSRQPLSDIILNLANDASSDKYSQGEGIARFMKFGNGSYKQQLTEKVRSDLFEALVGAIYVDCGRNIKEARKFILKHMHSALNTEVDAEISDSKSKLQEFAQKNNYDIEYILVEERGPDHQKVFTYEVYINGKIMGDGVGANKKLAQQYAAREALSKLNLNY